MLHGVSLYNLLSIIILMYTDVLSGNVTDVRLLKNRIHYIIPCAEDQRSKYRDHFD